MKGVMQGLVGVALLSMIARLAYDWKKEHGDILTGEKQLPALPAFWGLVVHRPVVPHQYYDFHANQYASSSFPPKEMEPAAIIYPTAPHADGDVLLAIKYARDNGLAIAVRTGGHQYSGASSTGGPNIQLDMSKAYKDFDWDGDQLVTMGISYKLKEFNKKLGALGLFVPHGQCSNVHIGGHAQTGGYGQLARSFGLFGDTIQRFRVITADGKIREVSRDAEDQDEKDLFYGFLGGSPGNFGVLTHITIKANKDSDHPKSRGLKLTTLYNNETLLNFLKLKAEMVADDEVAADYDFCISVASGGQSFTRELNNKHIDAYMRTKHPHIHGDTGIPFWPAAIIVYIQWANLGGEKQFYDPNDPRTNLITRVKKVAEEAWAKEESEEFWAELLKGPIRRKLIGDDEHVEMSKLTRTWIFDNAREFDLPYNKRAFFTNFTNLDKNDWAEKVTKRIDELQRHWLTSGCKIVVQIQHIGGKHSRYRNNDPGTPEEGPRTAYSWRDTSVISVLDSFYDPDALFVNNWYGGEDKAKAIADEWQRRNDEQLKGPEGFFSPNMDRRMLWGSYESKEEEKDMSIAWPYYHETSEKFARLCAIKNKFDPHNVFTPNKFSVPTSMPVL